MDFTVAQVDFGRALRLVGRVAPARPTLPILQSVLLEGGQGKLTLAATDLEVAVTTTVAAEVLAPGRIAVPARLLGDYVAQLPSEPLRLAQDAAQQRVKLKCGRFTANLATVDPDDFPTFPPLDDSQALDLGAVQLREAIDRVAFAASRDDSRPVLTAVLFDFSADGLTIAAADGLRLARVHLPAAPQTARQLLLPARAVVECGRLLANAREARLTFTQDGRGVYLVAGETRLFTRLLEGQYPDIGRVIPQGWRTRVTVDAASLRQAVRVASLFGGGDARPVLLDATQGTLSLQAKGDETGEARSELTALLEGEPQAVALNTRLLTDLLDAPSSQQLELSWTSPQAPVVVREVCKDDTADLWVVMPLHDPALIRREAKAA